MRIGFPVVVKRGDRSELVKVFASEVDAAPGVPCVLFDGLGQVAADHSLEALPTSLHQACREILNRGKSLRLAFESRTNAAVEALYDRDKRRLDMDGQSGTLALYLVSHFGSDLLASPSPDDVLVSARVFWKDDGYRVGDLKSPGDLKTKVDGTREPLWLHRNDFDALDAATQSHSRIVPFDAPGDRLEWLLHELAEQYGLRKTIAAPARLNLKQTAGPNTERDLFEAAINKDYFSGNVEGDEDTFGNTLQAHFGPTPPRLLLPVQQKALEEDRRLKREFKHSIFYDPMHPELLLRHVVVSGPTGCGKTTLLQSLVLNGLYNRSGGVLYIGPVKALVEEFHSSLLNDLSSLIPDQATQPLLLSTGDYSKDDGLITQGRYGLACLVNEKANVLFSSGDMRGLLGNLSLVIVDELHMLRDASRGGILDLLLTKVALEASRRRKVSEPRPLQLVMVSTESMAKTVVKLPLYRSDPEDPETGPVALEATQRPIKVVHSVAVLSEVKPEYSLRKIVTFEGNANRALREDERAALLKAMGPRSDPWARWVSPSLRRSFTDGQIQKLILDKRLEHKTMIVALPSVDSTYSNANGVTNKLTHRLDLHAVDDEFRVEVARSGLGASLQEKLLRWATRGVFVHHSQLPRRLRSVTEGIFRAPAAPNSRPKILLTTETLTYGVNLSAGCVILSTLEWNRDDPTNPFVPPSPEELDVNQYHNLLGRAGRLGLMAADETAEAIVCIPVSRFEAPKHRADFLTRYYSESVVSPGLFSSIAQPADLHRFEFDRESREAVLKAKETPELTEHSFSLFRSTMDALRTAGSGVSGSGGMSVSAAKALEVFRSTLCFETAKARNEQGTQAKLEACFRTVLDRAASYGKGNIKLVSQINDEYATTAAASALIDTGTSLVSVEPMAIWLQMLQAREDFQRLGTEALLPALVVAPDFTKIACELIPGAMSKDKFENQDDARRRLKEARDLAVSELQGVGAVDLVASVDEFLQRPEIMQALRLVAVVERRSVVFWQLLTAVLRWLRGNPEELVRGSLVMFKSGEKRWLPKHADRLEQLAKMCYRFFSLGDDDFLSKQQKLQLPQLALRLKHGIPFNATPYLNVFSLDGILPREAVVALHRAVPDPFRLLQGKAADLVKIQQVLDTTPTNANGTDEVVAVVRKAFTEYRSAFLNVIDRDSAAEFVLTARDSFASEQEAFGNAWTPTPLLQSFIDHVQEREGSDEFHFEIAAGVDGSSFEMSAAGKPPRIAFGRDGPAAGTPFVRVLAWHELPQGKWSVTPCAFVLLMSLFLRRLVDVGTLDSAMAGAPQRMDVYWIASHLWDAPGLDDMSALREDLLTFVEPVQQVAAGG